MISCVALTLIGLIFQNGLAGPVKRSIDEGSARKTKAVVGAPFCALIVREQRENSGPSLCQVHILVERPHVNEPDLSMLFAAVSQQYAQEPTLKAFVSSDLAQLKWLSTATA
jgi:hypothetical protein